MEIQQRLYIGGRFVPAEDGATMPSLNPHDNTPLADVSMAGKADIDKAVEAAHAAFPKWSRTAAAERGRLLLKLADKIEERADELARLETLDTGHPLRATRALDARRTAAAVRAPPRAERSGTTPAPRCGAPPPSERSPPSHSGDRQRSEE